MMLTPILTLQRNLLVKGLRRVESEEFCELATVLSILVDTQLNVLAEGLVELLEVVLILRDLLNEVEALLNDVLADDLKDLVLLEGFSRNVKRKILGVDDTLDEVKVLWNEFLTVVHNEDAADVKLDVVPLLL